MKKTRIEPGLLAVFQLFIGLRLAIIGLELIVKWFRPLLLPDEGLAFSITTADTLSLVTTITLIIYLLFPWLQNKLGKIYLPVGLLIASLSPIIEKSIRYLETPHGLLDLPMVGAWQLILILIVPLILIAWQYEFHWVVFFSLVTGLLDLALLILLQGTLLDAILPFLGVILIRTMIYLSAGYMVTKLMMTQRIQRLTLAQFNNELVRYNATVEQLTISRERNRMARELHDTLAHTLSGVAIQLEAVKSLWNSNQNTAYGLLEQSLAATRAGLSETRRALQAFRATPLEEMGLAIALRSLGESVANRCSLSANIDIPDISIPLSPEMEQSFYRIAQEAFENISRHANARRFTITLTKTNGLLKLVISDDGLGFDPQVAGGGDHYGLKGMKERADLIGAHLSIISQSGYGTTIVLDKELEK